MTILRMIQNNAWNANIKKKSKNNLHLQIYCRINTCENEDNQHTWAEFGIPVEAFTKFHKQSRENTYT